MVIKALCLLLLIISCTQGIAEDFFQVFRNQRHPYAQYAVLYVTGSTDDPLDNTSQLTKKEPLQVNSNYVAAKVDYSTKPPIHTERTVMTYAKQLVEKFRAAHKEEDEPRMFLYTFNSPCCTYEEDQTYLCKSGCGREISEFITNSNDINILYLLWSQIYQEDNNIFYAKQFFTTLNTVLSSGKVVLAVTPPLKWLQGIMYQCLNQKDYTKHFFKSKLINLAKFINHATWCCAVVKGGEDNLKNPDCFKDDLEHLLGRTCNKFKEYIAECFTENSPMKLGPPMDASTLRVSSSTTDLRGNYGHDWLEFNFAEC